MKSAPAKRQAVSPKLNVIRQLCARLAPGFRRFFAEAGRVVINPATAAKLVAEAEATFASQLATELGKTGLPLAGPTSPWPPAPKAPKEGEAAQPVSQFWAYAPLLGRRNFLHARSPVAVALGHLKTTEKGPLLTTGAVYFPLEDVLVAVEGGVGANHTSSNAGSTTAMGRLRVGARTELADALITLPWRTEDAVAMNLLEKSAAASLHTRKSGLSLFDVVDVASARADAAVLASLSPLEWHLAALLMQEAGGVLTDLATGKPLNLQADLAAARAIASNTALSAALVKQLG